MENEKNIDEKILDSVIGLCEYESTRHDATHKKLDKLEADVSDLKADLKETKTDIAIIKNILLHMLGDNGLKAVK